MIPGDIDLTENLDFRKVVKKEIPQLPDTWKENKINISNSSYFTTNVRYSLQSNDRTYRLIYNDITYEEWIENDSIYTSNTIDNIYYNTSSTSISNDFVLEYIEEKDEYDVFGNKKEHIKPIPNIPWGSKPTYHEKDIPWKLKSIYHEIGWYYNKSYERYKDIPWEDYAEYHDYDLVDKISRARHLISWLSGKTRNFINDYFKSDEDDVDLSYLTNMSWIRVRDAIIE